MPQILCVQDRDEGLEALVSRIGHTTRPARSLTEALDLVDRHPIDLIVTGLQLGSGTGLDLVEELRKSGKETPVIIMHPGSSSADMVTRSESENVLNTTLDVVSLQGAVEKALSACGLQSAQPEPATSLIVGNSSAIRDVLKIVNTVAATKASVLIQGESGTGKELLVKAVHEASPRAGKPFVAVNCAAIPEGLVESTLFGHERGSFTGATTRCLGAFERASGGTLLLDEVSELRLDLQAKLLRAIQEQEFERVGGGKPVHVDVRVVATSNRPLEEEVQTGRFRSDLYYRLRVVPIDVPPLRHRAEDIPVLVEHFVKRSAGELGVNCPSVPSFVKEALSRRSWPGNVRELEHAVERAVILNQSGSLTLEDFSEASLNHLPAPGPKKELAKESSAEEVFNLQELERQTIERALDATGGHRMKAAELLGISDRTLRNKLNGPSASAKRRARDAEPFAEAA